MKIWINNENKTDFQIKFVIIYLRIILDLDVFYWVNGLSVPRCFWPWLWIIKALDCKDTWYQITISHGENWILKNIIYNYNDRKKVDFRKIIMWDLGANMETSEISLLEDINKVLKLWEGKTCQVLVITENWKILMIVNTWFVCNFSFFIF